MTTTSTATTQTTTLTDASGKAVAWLTWDSPVYAKADNSQINVNLALPGRGPSPFTVDPTDTGAGFDTAAFFNAIKASGVAIGAYTPLP